MNALAAYAPAGLIALAALTSPIALSATSAPPRVGEPVIVLTAPWRPAEDVISASDGVLLDRSVFPFVAVAYAPETDFFARLEATGALSLLNTRFGALLLCG